MKTQAMGTLEQNPGRRKGFPRINRTYMRVGPTHTKENIYLSTGGVDAAFIDSMNYSLKFYSMKK